MSVITRYSFGTSRLPCGVTGTLKGMAALFSSSPLLALFVVVALGAAIGAIRIGPLRFGAAGALFVGLTVSAIHPEVVSTHMSIVQSMGLAFFVYCVGISAGATFFQDLRKQTNLLALTTLVCVVGAVITFVGGRLLGLSSGLASGLFTGALTAAPALDTATRLTGDANAAVGYAFGYPIGVIGGILIVTITVTRKWLGPKDTPSLAGASLEAVSVHISKQINTRDITAWREQRVRLSYLRRGDRTRVIAPGEDLLPGDHVVMVGDPASIKDAAPLVGEILDHNLEDDRSDLAFERIVVSNPDVAGRSVSELNVTKRFGAVITRVRRGDLDLLARDDLDLQLGDHVAVVVPTDELDDIAQWLGDSERRVAEVDGMAFGIGLVLGLLLGIVSFPLPGGQGFQLGAAAGPLIVGMLLGALRRTGPLVWTLPAAANLTIRQIGLMLFLAALGLNAGPQFASLLGSPDGWRAAVLAAVMVLVCCVLQALGAKFIGLSAPRAAGGVAGFLGQPAVLQAADARVTDERIEAAYATLFAFAIIVKILLLPMITSFL